MHNFLNYIRSLASFSDESWRLLQPALTMRKYKKMNYSLRRKDRCVTRSYIDRGYCKSYYVVDGIIKNTGFYFRK